MKRSGGLWKTITPAPVTLLTDNVDILHKIALALIEKESLNGSDVDEIIGRKDVAPSSPA